MDRPGSVLLDAFVEWSPVTPQSAPDLSASVC